MKTGKALDWNREQEIKVYIVILCCTAYYEHGVSLFASSLKFGSCMTLFRDKLAVCMFLVYRFLCIGGRFLWE